MVPGFIYSWPISSALYLARHAVLLATTDSCCRCGLCEAINANINVSILFLRITDGLPVNRGALQNAQTPMNAIF